MENGKRRLLLVDDEPSIIKMVGKRLEVEGFEVEVATDGEAALDQARITHPDVIVLDLMLPKLSGLKVCALLKHEEQYQRVPIIIFTGKDEVVDEVSCRECGADGFITKAQGTEALLKKIYALLGSAEKSSL